MLRPFEAALAGDKALPFSGITLVFEVTGDPIKPVAVGVNQDLRVLAVFSLPTAQSPLNLRSERQALRRLVRELSGGGKQAALEFRYLQYGATRDTLRDVLEDGDGWDIVHFSGHGMPGRLVLEKRDGSPDTIDAQTLAEIFGPIGRALNW